MQEIRGTFGEDVGIVEEMLKLANLRQHPGIITLEIDNEYPRKVRFMVEEACVGQFRNHMQQAGIIPEE